jgi:hypothetical protein
MTREQKHECFKEEIIQAMDKSINCNGNFTYK